MNVHRIVVGLDLAPQSRSALAAAAALAQELDAELEAHFVESDDLHRLAALPFAREMGFSTASWRPMDTAALARSLEAGARDARRVLATLAQPRAFRWSLRVARGTVTEQLIAAAAPFDIAVIGIARWGPEALRLAAAAPIALFVLRAGPATRGPLVALCPTGAEPGQSLPLLCSLAHAVKAQLTILVMGSDLARSGEWCLEASAVLESLARRANFEILGDTGAETLQAALKRLAPCAIAVVTPAPSPPP